MLQIDPHTSVAAKATDATEASQPNATTGTTLHQRVEADRARTPGYSSGTGTTRLAALVAAAKSKLETPTST